MTGRVRALILVGCVLIAGALGAGIYFSVSQPRVEASSARCDAALASVLAVNDLRIDGPGDTTEGRLAADCTVTELEPAIAAWVKTHPVDPHMPGNPATTAHVMAGVSCVGFPNARLCRSVSGGGPA